MDNKVVVSQTWLCNCGAAGAVWGVWHKEDEWQLWACQVRSAEQAEMFFLNPDDDVIWILLFLSIYKHSKMKLVQELYIHILKYDLCIQYHLKYSQYSWKVSSRINGFYVNTGLDMYARYFSINNLDSLLKNEKYVLGCHNGWEIKQVSHI